jgi:hypothetical protein
MKRKLDALKEKTLLPEEADSEFEDWLVRTSAKRVANAKRQKWKEETSEAALRPGKMPSACEMQQLNVHVDPALPNREQVKRQARLLGVPVTLDIRCAQVFVVADVVNPGDHITWRAIMVGGYIMRPDCLLKHGTFPCLKYKPALSTIRHVWVSDGFKTKHPEHYAILMHAMDRPGVKWKLLSPQEYSRLSASRPRKQGLAALVTQDDLTNAPVRVLFIMWSFDLRSLML